MHASRFRQPWVPSLGKDAETKCPRKPDRGGRWPFRRRDLYGQIWPGKGPVLLGPRRKGERSKFVLGACCSNLGGKQMGRDVHTSNRNGSRCPFSRGRS